jgi:hypothetical protein
VLQRELNGEEYNRFIELFQRYKDHPIPFHDIRLEVQKILEKRTDLFERYERLIQLINQTK